jgi:hypothetical protein
MFDQTMLDALIVIGMFVLRIGLPATILFGLAAWVEKRLRSPESRETEKRNSGARIIPFTRPNPSAEMPRASDENAVRRTSIR